MFPSTPPPAAGFLGLGGVDRRGLPPAPAAQAAAVCSLGRVTDNKGAWRSARRMDATGAEGRGGEGGWWMDGGGWVSEREKGGGVVR